MILHVLDGISAPDFAVVELTVKARVKPSEADAIRQTVLNRVNCLCRGTSTCRHARRNRSSSHIAGALLTPVKAVRRLTRQTS